MNTSARELISRWIKKSWLALAVLPFLLAGCSPNSPDILEPRGPAARSIATLGWIFIILGTVIFLATMAYLWWALRRARPQMDQHRGGTRVVIIAGLLIPALILSVLFVLNTNVLGQVSAPGEDEAEVIIEIVGRQWWWEVYYPEQRIRTANEIHIPVGQPVLLRLVSEDVIHSFWVPELHGKMDTIPGRVNDFWIEADEAGVYMGACAEYCGTQHAKMLFRVVAEEQDTFDAWLANNQQPIELPQDENLQRGLEVFIESNCVECHTIRGTEATGNLGPDLTHLASRQTLGSAIVPLTRSNLGGWISNPQGVKPGVKMPPTELSSEDMNALLDFLLTLD